jgi:hypothetical protein
MDDLRLASMRRLNLAFQILLAAALAVIACLILRALVSHEFRAGFLTVRGIQSVTEQDLAFPQRAILVAIAALPDLCWMYGLVQLLTMSMRFRRGEFFSDAAIVRFQRFGWALGAMALCEAVCHPGMAMYLVWLGKIDPPTTWWQYAVNGEPLNSLLAAVLVIIVAKILRNALQMHEDLQLTV